ncbi:MAG: efflux RND transporter periplasmic adaptor subunit [Deltaproteobacteria bacterium]|nr:efflux RND transporter periplasmic adaptor subunit [Deltaproteobacteria bacterium]
MSRTLITLACAAALCACAPEASEPARVRSGALALEARVTPAALRVGENQLEVTLRDASGAPVSGAHVEADVRMHAMGAMPEMGGPERVSDLGEGRYRADFGLEMGGTWQVEITAHAPGGETLQAEGSLTVGSPGLRLAAAGASAAASPTTLASGESPGAFSFPAERLQQIGVRTVRAEVKPLARTLRATARVTFDESALADVSPKVSGWAESVAVTAVGEPVARGETLLTLYSPDLYAAQREYQQALASRARAEGAVRAERSDALVRAAERRLAQLGIARADVEAIAQRTEPLQALPIRAPASGFVLEKNVVAGGAVSAGERLYRIAPSERVWLEAAIPESDLALVREGTRVRIALAGDTSAEPRAGRVARVLPQLTAESRTGAARIALAAPAPLRPDAWASVEIDVAASDGLAVPSSAVLRAGERSFVFVAKGGGRFEPRAVTLGFETADAIEIRSGLASGEEVVSEGTYLVASESRLRAALETW